MQNLVVDTEDNAKKAIGYLKRRDGGRCTFLPLNAIRIGECDAYSFRAHGRRYLGLNAFGLLGCGLPHIQQESRSMPILAGIRQAGVQAIRGV